MNKAYLVQQVTTRCGRTIRSLRTHSSASETILVTLGEVEAMLAQYHRRTNTYTVLAPSIEEKRPETRRSPQ